jgi:glutathione synthase
MTLKVAIQMDPIESINPHRDSTLLMGIEACRRGHELYYYTPYKLTYNDGKISASAHPIQFFQDPAQYYKLGESLTLDLKTMDVVLLRQDPPFNMAYITTTHILEFLAPKTLVVNDPASVRNHPEKLFPLSLREFMPPTLVTADINEIEYFRRQYKDIIIKPLYGYGGRAVLRLKADDDNLSALMEMHLATSLEPLMVQTFLPEVTTGDRRIILIDGRVGGVMGRIPAEHEIRANFRVGGSAAKADLTAKQREICEKLGPELKEKGLIFAGLDVIGDYLTEINLTSPTGLVQINALNGTKLEVDIWDAIEGRIEELRN